MSTRTAVSVFALLIGVSVLASPALGTLVTYKTGYPDPFTGATYDGTEDTILYEGAPNNNYGAHNIRFTVGASYVQGDWDRRRSPLRFDLSSLAGQYEAILSATLRIQVEDPEVDAANTLKAYRFTDANVDWVEGSSLGPAAAGESTWNYRQHPGTDNWLGTQASDYVGGLGAQIASVAFDSTLAAGDWLELEFNDPSVIDDWVTGTNAGLLLRVVDETEPDASKISFFSSDHATAALHPELVLDIAVPEPSMAVVFCGLVLAAGSLRSIARRRR